MRLACYTIDDRNHPEHRAEHRLVTSLLDPEVAPAEELVLAHHARWKFELAADEGGKAPGERWPDTRIADALEVSRSTVRRVRGRFCAEGLEAAIVHRRPKNTKPRKLDGCQEAHLIALACSEPPTGKRRWSIRLLAERFVEMECGVEVSRELVRRTLKKVG